MATFYVLPPRDCLESAVSELFCKLLPGLPLPADAWDTLTCHLAHVSEWGNDVYFVPRDELPEGDLSSALSDAYGAEPGDRVVEVSLSRAPRSWLVSRADVSNVVEAR
jgi:hypothetical protein